MILLATTSRSEASKGGLGERVVSGDVRHYGIRRCNALLQARHQVSSLTYPDVVTLVLCTQIIKFLSSVQTWALREAKERMEARGDKYQYEPQPPPSSS